MVTFSELRIARDNNYLIVDAKVRSEAVYKNIWIEEVVVCNHKSFSDSVSYESIKGAHIHIDDQKSINLKLDAFQLHSKHSAPDDEESQIDLSKDLIFVYVITNDDIDISNCPNISCDMTNRVTIGATLNMSIIYNQFMKYINELEKSNCKCDCNSTKLPSGFTDFILRYNAFMLALDSRHLKKAIEFFEKWFSGEYNTITSNCGCNG